MARIVPVGDGKEVVEMVGETGLARPGGAEDGYEDEALGGNLDRVMGEDAAGAEELEGLDLDRAGGLVEVLDDDTVGDAEGRRRRRRAGAELRPGEEVRADGRLAVGALGFDGRREGAEEGGGEVVERRFGAAVGDGACEAKGGAGNLPMCRQSRK